MMREVHMYTQDGRVRTIKTETKVEVKKTVYQSQC